MPDPQDRKASPKPPKQPPLHTILLTSSFASRNRELVTTPSKHQLVYSIAGLVLGLACVIGGLVLFLFGVTGSTSWTARFLGAKSQITDAAPGAVLFIVGLFTVFFTRYVLTVR